MNLFCFGVLLTLSLLMLLPAPSEAFIARSTGCHHNGTWYADKSLVPTIEKCLNCQCSKKTLVCRLKVCPEMPMPPPRGCVIVQKKHTCCPYLSCARLEAFYKIPITRRIIAYLDHYERESIDRVVNENMLQRRSDDSEVDLMVCVKNGTVYKSGSAMSSSNLCTYCYCIGGQEKCVKPKCMLPVDGCKPIFVDSTCCPVRYDCSIKTSGKSSQEVRYRKTANKHFQRMSQRLQRNRGCTVNDQFYAEGQKMKSDTDKPCDICFCIRGSRRCSPKKCSPALKNCIPVVPKGQCCPSSYDCGSQRDYRRSHNSRQFNLFALLFGKDEEKLSSPTAIPEHYPHDRDPALTANKYKTHEQALEASSEKSILETLREGLEFIDSSNKQFLKENQDLLTLQAKRETINNLPTSTPMPPLTTTQATNDADNATTEISFLDLLLGEAEVDLPKIESAENQTTPSTITSSENQDELSWVDILLGPPVKQNSNISRSETLLENTTNGLSPELITSIDRLDDDVENDFGTSGEIFVSAAEDVKTLSMLKAAQLKSTTSSTTTATTNSLESTTESVKIMSTQDLKQQKPLIKPIPFHSAENESQIFVTALPLNKLKATTSKQPITTTTTKPVQKTDILAAFLDGITDILGAEKLDNITTTTTAKPRIITKSTLDPTQPLPSFKPLPAQKQHTRINSKIANLTVSTPKIVKKPIQNVTFKPLPTSAPKLNINAEKLSSTTTKRPHSTTTILTTTKTPTTTTTTTSTTTTTIVPHHSTTVTTVKPLIIKTNPTILESEPLDVEGAEPTLPPSLPNLKIIPFLPTDAVEAASTKIFDYASQASKSSYESFDDAKLYPAITEHPFVSYDVDMEDDNKAKYIYKFKVEGPAEVATASKTPTDESFLKYKFVDKNGFSPPTKTEGGFMPKEPLPVDDEILENGKFNVSKLNEIFPATMHIIDITTASPLGENLTKIIEITTPDPFKDVIHTESPPDLTAFIQDKLDIEHIIVNSTYAAVPLHQNLTEIAPRPFSAPAPTTPAPTLLTSFDKNSMETFLDILFKDEQNENSFEAPFERDSFTSTIPPFKNLPQTTMSLFTTTKSTTQPATTKTKTTKTTTTRRPQRTKSPPISGAKDKQKGNVNTAPRPQTSTTTTTTVTSTTKSTKPKHNNNVIRNITTTTSTPKSTINATAANIATTSTTKATVAHTQTTTSSSATASKIYAEKTTKPTLLLPPTISTHKPFLMSPFDKLPFMDASFEIKRHQAAVATSASAAITSSPSTHRPLVRLDGLDAAYEISNAIVAGSASPSLTLTARTSSTTSHPPLAASSVSQKLSTSASNSLIDPAGILKLAGCNIYGRMYRVGRIILELSSPCVECKCTETGVKCGQLDC